MLEMIFHTLNSLLPLFQACETSVSPIRLGHKLVNLSSSALGLPLSEFADELDGALARFRSREDLFKRNADEVKMGCCGYHPLTPSTLTLELTPTQLHLS